MNITTSEFFMNMKSLPPEGTDEFKQLIDWEVDKCINGVHVNGIHFSGWLYFHLNHWHIRLDLEDGQRPIKLPHLRDNEWIRAEHFEKCKKERKGYIEIGRRQAGKDLLNSSKLYTLDREITIGDCEIGQQIYDDQGKLTTIVGKYPQGKKSVYKMTLVDGRELYCGLDHNWYVWDRFKKKYFKKTTRELIENYKKYRPFWKNRKNPYEYRYSIPNSNGVDYEEKQLDLPPYLLGLWLGDGSNYGTKITTADTEIINYLKNYCEVNNLNITKDGKYTYLISGGKKSNKWKNLNCFHNFLNKNNLYQNKHIPKKYLYSSREQRMELLKGLMDSDGSCDIKGGIEFSNTCSRLVSDVEFLIRSLGITVKKTKKQGSYKDENGNKVICKDVYRLILFTKKNVFKLPRKTKNIFTKPKYEKKCPIINIEYVFDEETTCIEVNNESHLFLTDDFTVTHNSEYEASQCGYHAILYKNSQNVIVGNSTNDINLMKDKIGVGLQHMWKGLHIPRLDKTWRGDQIRLGYKDKDNEDVVWSYIYIRNSNDGTNTEVAAGTTASSFIFDEVGKANMANVYAAAKPAFFGDYGLRAIPILVGTGGSFDKGKDAETIFFNPEAEGFLGVLDESTNRVTGLFMGGWMRSNLKKWMSLGDYLVKVKGLDLKERGELDKIQIKVADKEEGIKTILTERELKRKSPDQETYLKEVMYNPLTPEECFLSTSDNIFNIKRAKHQQEKIYDTPITAEHVFLEYDGFKILPVHTEKLPISKFPHSKETDLDAPICIWEHPMPDTPFGLYVCGVDPYRHETSTTKSLGSVYIYKRAHDIHSESLQETIVASYSARPDSKEKWSEQARLLIKYYNALTLCENDEISFIEYMKTKGDERYLEEQPPWVKTVAPKTKVTRKFGVHRSSKLIRNFLDTTLKDYLDEVVYSEKDEEGSIIYESFGVDCVFDPMLLEEIIKFNNDGNFDRIIAAQLAISLAKHLNPLYKVSSTDKNSKFNNYYDNNIKRKTSSPFTNGGGLFGKKSKRRLF